MTSTIMSRFFFAVGATITSSIFHEGAQLTWHLRNHNREIHDEKTMNDRYTHDALQDRIASMPGLDDPVGFRQFSGYLNVDESHGRNIFYWYVESQNSPENDPLVLWTNGGPGCSGLLGFGTEHGPFFVDRNDKVRFNPYSWNVMANMLYIEQPAGVGFSYSDNKDDYVTGDDRAARDNYVVIKEFLKRFPERQKNDFYIASESYGGHYMPQLTMQILERNTDGFINFKGMMVGNPYVDPFTNFMTQIAAYYNHGLLAQPLYSKWLKHCNDPKIYQSEECDELVNVLFAEFEGGANPYALDYPMCHEEDDLDSMTPEQAAATLLIKQEHDMVDALSRQWHVPSSQVWTLIRAGARKHVGPPFLPPQDNYKPCAEQHFVRYLNNPDVRKALHVKDSLANVKWMQCTDAIEYSEEDGDTSLIGLYKELLDMAANRTHDLRMLVFSGDDDAICSTASTQEWIWDLGYSPRSDVYWQPWEVRKQTAGFVTKFELGKDVKATFTFATVHGAGHEVPSYRPMEALELFRKYLQGEW